MSDTKIPPDFSGKEAQASQAGWGIDRWLNGVNLSQNLVVM